VINSSKGLLISRDGGKTWQQVTDGPGPGKDIRAIAVNLANPNFVAVGTDILFYTSEDKGRTWKEIKLGDLQEVDEIRIDNTAQIIYLGTKSTGVWRGILNYDSARSQIAITGVSFPQVVSKNGLVEVIVSVDNLGGIPGSFPINVEIGRFKSSQNLTLNGADQASAKFSTKLKPGTYKVHVNGVNYGTIRLAKSQVLK
jgi:hypothetical protein